jgi:saccharopine dehydrogenase-like NADP-dependent oxidoreductase
VVLLRVWIEQAGRVEGVEMVDRHDGRFSALARTTAFPATALADLIARGAVDLSGAVTMHRAVPGRVLLQEMEGVGIASAPWPIGVPGDG